jgi:hypothetical protein
MVSHEANNSTGVFVSPYYEIHFNRPQIQVLRLYIFTAFILLYDVFVYV